MPWLDLWVLCRVGAVLGVVLIAVRGGALCHCWSAVGVGALRQQFQKHT